MGMVDTSDAGAVSTRILTLPRLTGVAAAGLLVSATISLAADKPAAVKPAGQIKGPRQVLIVPDVRRQMFVFASGMLEDGGFGWKVRGGVKGYPANMVVAQSPKPGTHVIDNGAPTITVWLARNGAELGQPQDRSPYGASKVRRVARAHSN
jgi:beta-lactam-binding protein with PASTA domain